MRLPRQNRRTHRGSRTQPVILFVVGGYTFAIFASAVAEIQSLQGMRRLPSVYGKVHHTLVREGHRYWVVDANLHFGIAHSESTRVLLLADSPVALKVDSIARMAEISRLLPLPQSFQGDECSWYLGLTVMNGMVIPVVNPSSLLTHFEMNALEAAVPIQEAPMQAVGAMA